ncbi:CASP-like protein 5B1 isoform X3 [Cryptomeria japonica]|uniref:CASP-like protein 5B1 isoform X3 n=1 Tax=Cryptomeria japonica TaxID=3369 RepID=UPI0025AD162B|nr:CASP-like protein 5B1 isoform X3 [Cryptomeria japonica]
MKNLPGIPGTCGGLLLRVGQFLFAAASVVVMVTGEEFSSYTAFCYLVAAMGLQFLWSFGLATLDAYALLIKRGLRNPVLVSLFVVGDWVTATLSFAAACSTAGVAVLFDNDLGYCAQTHCRRYQISASLAFASWLLIGLSSLITFRLLATG